jgi:predicted RNA-binding protein YlqC (UPF0109 family)
MADPSGGDAIPQPTPAILGSMARLTEHDTGRLSLAIALTNGVPSPILDVAHPERTRGKAAGAAEAMEVRELVEEIVRALVDKPEEVVCTEVDGAHSCVLELQVAREDVGKVIGKKGVHADAIRRIVHAIGGKKKKRYVLEIIEE